MTTNEMFMIVKIHQFRVFGNRQLSNRYMNASVWLWISVLHLVRGKGSEVRNSHAEERSQEGSDQGQEIIKDGNGFGDDERDQAIGSHTRAVALIHIL